ncbi:MAG: hypothetical protein ACP5OP_09385 [Leptospirillia bacterium]
MKQMTQPMMKSNMIMLINRKSKNFLLKSPTITGKNLKHKKRPIQPTWLKKKKKIKMKRLLKTMLNKSLRKKPTNSHNLSECNQLETAKLQSV